MIRALSAAIAGASVAAVLLLPVSASSAAPLSAEDPPLDVESWKEKAERLLDEMRGTIRRRDQLAFEEELAALVLRGAAPPDEYAEELSSLLRVAPPGAVLDAAVRRLVTQASEASLGVLLDGLAARDYEDLDGRELGRGERETRHRVIEYYLLDLSDRIAAGELPVLALAPGLRESVEKRLRSDAARVVRSAAYLLGGARAGESIPALVEAFERVDDHETRAFVLEVLGRIDPAASAETILQAAEDASLQVKLAAIPLLGSLDGDEASRLIAEAMRDGNWMARRAAIESCRRRRDVVAMDLLIGRFHDETPRLQYDMLEALRDLTGGVLPPDPKEWRRWWKKARLDFRSAPPGGAQEESATVLAEVPQYFGFEVWSSRLAIAMDISGSMTSTNASVGLSGVGVAGSQLEGSPFAVARDQLVKLLKRMSPSTRFNIIAYNAQVDPLSKQLVPASRSNLRKTVQYINKLDPSGGTNIYGALATAFHDDEVDTIYLLSDGDPTDGLRTEPDDILESVQKVNRFRKTRIYTIQIGSESKLMREIARITGGEYRHVPLKGEKQGR